jgi:hypothetical protein
VLEEPQLMAAVRELPASALVRLIHHVGLEDAGELIALISTQQLGQVFDAELWQAAEPGSDETFRPERFALFLRLLYEAGETFVVERLQAMPRELLTLAVHKLLLVVDIDALTVRFSSAGRFFDDGMDRVSRAIDDAQFEEYEEFRLIARDPNAFEDLWNALLALDSENHELVRYVIERCCDLDGELIEESGLYAVLNDEDMLENDIASERSERRAARGFVSPADARAFLELARRASIDEAPDGRDPIARAYFRELAPEETSARPERALPAHAGVTPDVGRLLAVLHKANVFDDERDAASPRKLLKEHAERAAPHEQADDPGRSAAHGKAVQEQARSARGVKQTAAPGKAARGGPAARGDKEAVQRGEAARPTAKPVRTAAKAGAERSTSKRKGVRPKKAGRDEVVSSSLVAPPEQAAQDAEQGDARRLTLMAASMLLLREQDAALHMQRTEELGFLANVLVAGSRHDGRTYRPVEAIECALAVCSVGLERAHARPVPPTAAQGMELLRELSADKLFRHGYHALWAEVGERARAAVAQLLDIEPADVPAALSGGSATLIPQLEIEAADALALSALAEPEPWLAGTLAAHDHLFLASHQDIQHALSFLSAREGQALPS